jgi:hypothetical protein
MSAKTSIEKLKFKSFANCKPNTFVGLQVALFNHESPSVQLLRMLVFTTKLANKSPRHGVS